MKSRTSRPSWIPTPPCSHPAAGLPNTACCAGSAATGLFDVDDVLARAGELAGFIGAARHRCGFEGRRLVAVGFSNGANIGLAAAMLHPQVLDRMIAFSGMYPFGDRETSADLSGSRLMVLNGDVDPMAPLPSVSTLVAFLGNSGADAEQVLRPGGHGIRSTDLAAARDWLARQT